MNYVRLIQFLLPLVLTVIVQELSGQVLNGGMARVPHATETLASYGLAWGLVSLLVSPLSQVKQLSLVLVDTNHAFKKVQQFVVGFGFLLAMILTGLAVTPVGVWVIEGLHGVDQSLGAVVREAILWLVPIPFLRGVTLFYSGLLIRIRRTDLVSYAILLSIGVTVLAVFGFLPTSFVQQRPIRLPVLVIYAGILAELLIVYWGYNRFYRNKLLESGKELTFIYIVQFFWPLALIMIIQGFSRPLINLFIAREKGGADALAVLTIVYSLAHVMYGWLNEIRNLPPAFREMKDFLRFILRFAIACGLVSFGLMIVLFWTPVREYILIKLIGIEFGLAGQARLPLIIFSFFPLAVMLRAYLHGKGLVQHRTKALAPSAPSRIIAILVILLITPSFKTFGATRGIAALLAGFVVETLVVWWGINGRVPRLRLPRAEQPVN